MKKYMIIVTAVFLTVWFTSCSDEGNASFKNGTTVISLVGIDCVTTPTTTDIANYETLLSGDTIVKDDNNAIISIYHDVNGTKKICLINNGSSAHLLR